MSVLDRVRIESAVQRYDLALDLYGVRGRDRRGLRRELRTNLRDAGARQGGAGAALAAIGSPEQLARESAAAIRDPRRPAWSQGLTWAGTAVALYWLLCVWSMFAFMDGALAARVDHEVTGNVTLLPGIEVHLQHTPTELSGGFVTGPAFWLTSLLLFLLVLVVTARVWRPLRHHSC